MPTDPFDNLEVFYGELTPARATVYARLEGLQNTDGLSLNGFVRGPRCFYSKTLPATFRLQDAGPGSSLLARSLVPDPSYWSSETPHIYDVTVELRKGTDVIASEVRQIGFKPLGISGRFFTWEGKPWVLRGVMARFVKEEAALAEWRERSTMMIPRDPHHELLQDASERGVMCFAFADGNKMDELHRLTRYPAVALLNIFDKYPDSVPTPNIINSQYYHFKGFQLAEAAQVAIGGTTVDLLSLTDQFEGPIIAYRAGEHSRLMDARAACDKLQADLAPIGQFAGYIV